MKVAATGVAAAVDQDTVLRWLAGLTEGNHLRAVSVLSRPGQHEARAEFGGEGE